MDAVLVGSERIRPCRLEEGSVTERLTKVNGVLLFQFNAINLSDSSTVSDRFSTAIEFKVNPILKSTLREWIQSKSVSERAYLEITWSSYPDTRVFLKVASIVDRLSISEGILRRAYAAKTAEGFFSYMENLEKNTREVYAGLAWVPLSGTGLQARISIARGLLWKANLVSERMAIGSTMILHEEQGIIHKAEDGKMQISMILSREKSVYKIYTFACGKCFVLEKRESLKEVEQQVIASIIEQSVGRGTASFPGLPKFSKVIDSVVKEDLSPLDVKLVLSEPYECSAANIISRRQRILPVSTRIVLKEGLSALSGLDTLINKLGFIHANIKLENVLYVRDREMLIGDMSGLIDISSAEKWLKSYETLDYASSHNFWNDIFTIQNLCEWGILLKREDLVTIEEISDRAQRALSKEESVEFVFKWYRQAAEKVAVFQLGVLFYQLLFEGNLPYSLKEKSEYMEVKEGDVDRITEALIWKIGVPMVAKTIASMLAIDLRSRPTVAEAVLNLKSCLCD